MALKKLTFVHPDGKSLNIELEETMEINTFMDHLKAQEVLDYSSDYSLITENGITVSDGETFNNFKERKFIIKDPNNQETSSDASDGFIIDGDIETPRQFHQLGIFVLDGSGSMSQNAQGGLKKADAVNVAMRDLLTRFKVSGVKENFSFSVITFDNSAKINTPIVEAPNVDDNADYNPLNGHGGGTNIFNGLEMAEQMANDFLNQYVQGGPPHSVIILLMTDGACFEPHRTKQVADRIKNGVNGGKITICTTYFGTVGNKDLDEKTLLRYLASDSVLGYKEVFDAETLRGFFQHSISTASGVNL